MQLGRCNEGATAIFLSSNQAVANALIQRRTADAQNARGLSDFEAKVRKRFRNNRHKAPPCPRESELSRLYSSVSTMRTPLYVPVILKWDGISYVGSFLEDRYLPSRGDWSFGGVFATSPSLGITVIYSDMLSAAYPVQNDSDRSGEMWCGIDPGPKQWRVEVCTALDYFAKYSDHFPQAWRAAAAAAVAPGNFKFNEGVLFITPNAKSVELHYHDYDAEARAENGHQ